MRDASATLGMTFRKSYITLMKKRFLLVFTVIIPGPAGA